MNQRPWAAGLLFSSMSHNHFGDTFGTNLFYDGDVTQPHPRPRPFPRQLADLTPEHN